MTPDMTPDISPDAVGRAQFPPGDWTVVDEGWGHAAPDFATLSEPANVREYVSMHHHLGVRTGDALLDLACGSGLAIELAALRGARPAGIDASQRLVAIARDRNIGADVRVGDMCALPWDDDAFDVVTSFRGIWGTTPDALAEAFRVLRPGGRIGLTVWGHIKLSPGAWALAPFRLAAAPTIANQAAMVGLGRPGVGEAALARYGFGSISRVAIPFVWEFADPETYARTIATTGPAYEAIQHVGAEEFHRAALAVAAERVRDGLPLRAEIDVVGYLARKPLHRTADVPHHLAAAPLTPESEALERADVQDLGFVMNATRLWGWRPEAHDRFFELAGLVAGGALGFRERGLIVLAAASTIGDPYCATAWGTKLAPTVGDHTVAAMLRGDDNSLEPAERAMTAWVRRVMRDAMNTEPADLDDLRRAGVDDERIFSITLYAALRMAFSTVNNALGARTDAELLARAPSEVLSAITTLSSAPVAVAGADGAPT
jgi:SAM-dependent methyltransferase